MFSKRWGHVLVVILSCFYICVRTGRFSDYFSWSNYCRYDLSHIWLYKSATRHSRGGREKFWEICDHTKALQLCIDAVGALNGTEQGAGGRMAFVGLLFLGIFGHLSHELSFCLFVCLLPSHQSTTGVSLSSFYTWGHQSWEWVIDCTNSLLE